MERNSLNEIIVSVIVPSYNVEHVASLTAHSLISQNYPSQNYEIIWIDDSSTDRTYSLLEPFKEHDNFFLYRNKTNKGRNWSRNYGISVSKGKIIIFLDSDNVVSNDFVKAHADLNLNTRTVGLGNLAVRDENYINGFVRYFNSHSPEVLVKKKKIPEDDIPPKYLCTANCSFLKEDYVAVGGILNELVMGDDDYLGYQFSKLGLHIKFVKDAISDHRDHNFRIQDYFFKLYTQGDGYRILKTNHPEAIKLSKFKYLDEVSFKKDKNIVLFISKTALNIIFKAKLPLFVLFIMMKIKTKRHLPLSYSCYRLIMAYGFYMGYRQNKISPWVMQYLKKR